MNAAGELLNEVYTQRLRLRLPCPADAPALAALMTPAVSARLASWPATMAPEAAAQRLGEALTAACAGLAVPLVIERRVDGALLGWISAARSAAQQGRAIITYWLGPLYQGQGVMREAAPVALATVFQALGVEEVRAAVQTDNLASRSVLRGMGMHFLSQGRIWCAARGREEDCEWWGVTRAGQGAAGTATGHDLPDSARRMVCGSGGLGMVASTAAAE